MEETTQSKRKRGIITIKTEWCKGCEICVEFCPKNVLAMERAKAVVRQPDACIACMQCELLCPDFAISVEIAGGEECA
ncbi:4Fe-4S binding protein [bacterium]|nr:4Fe-4S binding protein [candidate division CSSED10-310 bacterium]